MLPLSQRWQPSGADSALVQVADRHLMNALHIYMLLLKRRVCLLTILVGERFRTRQHVTVQQFFVPPVWLCIYYAAAAPHGNNTNVFSFCVASQTIRRTASVYKHCIAALLLL